MHIDMEDFKVIQTKFRGRPEDRRSAVEEACYDLLEQAGVAFDRAEHDPAMTIPMCHEVEAVLGTEICKNLFLCNRQKTEFYLLLIRGDKVFKTKYLSAQLGCARLSFAEGTEMERLLGVRPGSATVLGLMNDREGRVRLVIDRSVLSQERFACHPGQNTSTVSFSTKDLLEKVIPALRHEPTLVDLPEVEDG